MTIEELNQLAECGFITDVAVIAECKKNPELLNTIDFGQYVSQVTSPLDVKEAEDLLRELMAEAAEVALKSNTKLATALVIEKEMTFDLNGKNLSCGSFAEKNGEMLEGDVDSFVFWVKKGGKLTINGNGVVESSACKYSMAVWAQGGEVVINGGSYKNNGEGSDLIYASAGGKITINGGEFHPCAKEEGVDGTADLYTALNIKDGDRKTTKIEVYGGKFFNFDPANNASEGKNTSFVANGYESVEIESGVFEVRKIEEKKEEEVVVTPVEPEVIAPSEPEVEDSPVVVEEKEAEA